MSREENFGKNCRILREFTSGQLTPKIFRWNIRISWLEIKIFWWEPKISYQEILISAQTSKISSQEILEAEEKILKATEKILMFRSKILIFWQEILLSARKISIISGEILGFCWKTLKFLFDRWHLIVDSKQLGDAVSRCWFNFCKKSWKAKKTNGKRDF